MHSEDDQIVPYVAAGPLSAKLMKNGTMKTYKDFPAWHAHHSSGDDQCRLVGILERLRILPVRTFHSTAERLPQRP